MAIATNLDEGLDDEDRRLLGDVSADDPQSGAGPVPDDLDEIAPASVASPVAGPPVEGPQLDTIDQLIAEAHPAGQAPVDAVDAASTPASAATGEATSEAQRIVDTKRAEANQEVAQKQAEAAKEADEDARLERADYLEKRQQAENDLNARTKAYEQAKMVNPDQHRNTFKSKVAIIFGGLGAAFRSAGGGDSTNHAVANLARKWEQDAEIQKANIAALRDQAVMARTRLGDVDDGRRHMMRDADARLLSKYNAALKQGEAQLKAQGVPQAQIDADKRIVELRNARAAAQARAAKAADEHALNQARIEALKGKAARDRAKAAGKGKGEGGGGGGGRAQAVAQYLVDNPGDIPGAMSVAGPGFDEKRFARIVQQTKGTEGQNKNAHQAKVGTDALNAIEASGYKPDKAEIQKWLNNSRLVHLADKDGVVGGAAALAQGIDFPLVGKLVPQSEVDGLSPDAAAYFGNVRRYMETIGRAQSGAAISPSEWTNFFNQYGPNSKGGLEAARQYLNDQAKLSGVSGRQLNSGGAKAPPKADAGGFVVGRVMRLKSGKTVKITGADGSYVEVSGGR